MNLGRRNFFKNFLLIISSLFAFVLSSCSSIDKAVQKRAAGISKCPRCGSDAGMVALSDGRKHCPNCGYTTRW